MPAPEGVLTTRRLTACLKACPDTNRVPPRRSSDGNRDFSGSSLADGLRSFSPEPRQYLFPICFQRVLFVTTHQIHIELRNSNAGQLTKLFPVRLGRTDQAEAIHDLIRHEFRVIAVDFAMLLIVVP